MKKRFDPLWRIVGEDVSLQGHEDVARLPCPKCGVTVALPRKAEGGVRFRCGLCGAVSEVVRTESVSDDGTTEVVARLSE